MKSFAKIPCTVVTGFLGAGKTTLIRHLLENAGGRRIALIINEFGDIGVDREIVQGCGLEDCGVDEDGVVELANGCLCCTVADEFLPTMEALLARKPAPDHIVIETSGLALPKPLVKAFQWPEIRSKVTVDGVVAVIDGRAVADGLFAENPDAVQAQREADDTVDHENPLEEVYTDQLMCADMVVVNKADLLPPNERHALESDIARTARPGVQVLMVSRGKVPATALLGLSAAAEDDLESRPSHHDGADDHDHDDFESFAVAVDEIDDPAAFVKAAEAVIRDFGILRLKGFLAVRGKPMRHVVQAVGPRAEHYYDRPWRPEEARRGHVVVIGLHGLDRAGITAALKAATQPVAAE